MPHASATRLGAMTSHTNFARLRVLLLFGGQSGEHGISCATAAGVLANIDRSRFEVVPVGITRTGKWVAMPDDPAALAMGEDGPASVPEKGEALTLVPGQGHLVALKDSGGVRDYGRIDVAFPLLHGPYGEDGTVQGMLELAGLPYVGCGVASSAVCMDKPLTKALLDQAGLPVGRWQRILPGQWRNGRAQVLRELAQLGLPVFVKPCRAGSSLGITKVERETDLAAAIETAQRIDPSVIVEAALSGREIECAVLGAGHGFPARVSDPGCIALSEKAAFYDYRTKYLDHEAVQLQIPADIPSALADRVRQLARQAFQVLGCEGLARIDFFVDVDAASITINEVNTMPGFTPYSMYPKLWQHRAVSYSQLIGELIDLAYEHKAGLR